MDTTITVLIVLNYNNYLDTIAFVNKIEKYEKIYKIIIVDNHSSNNSYFLLCKTFFDLKKIDVIESPINRGYAAGNNFGIKYALSKYDFNNIIIANPDVEISEDNLSLLIQRKAELDKLQGGKIGIVAPVMKWKNSNITNYGWKQPRFIDDVRSNFMLINKLIKDPLHTFKFEYILKHTTYVDVVAGSFFLIDKKAIIAIGFLDENTFLYCEERILSYELKKSNYLNFILTDCFFIHNHSTSIKSSMSEIQMFRELNKSKRYYHSKYLQIGKFKKLVFSISEIIGVVERKIYFSIRQRKVNK